MIRLLCAALLAAALAACATAPQSPADQEPPPAAVTPPPVAAEANPATEPAPAAAPLPEPLAVDLARIENQTPADVLAYLGAPTLVRRDENVQIMIFETVSCVVEVIFFEPENGDHFRAERINARSRSGQNTDIETCTREWLETRRTAF